MPKKLKVAMKSSMSRMVAVILIIALLVPLRANPFSPQPASATSRSTKIAVGAVVAGTIAVLYKHHKSKHHKRHKVSAQAAAPPARQSVSQGAGEGQRAADMRHVMALNRLNGAFIQYWGLLDEATWNQVLDAMQRAGLKIIILQWLENDGSKFYPAIASDFDPTRHLLVYARTHQMQVYIGLRHDSRFEKVSNWNTPDYAKELNTPGGEADKNKALANLIWQRYGAYSSFAGWYLPNEMWNQNYTVEQLTELRRFHRTISDHCKGLDNNNKAIAVCPFFNPLDVPNPYLNATDFAQKFGELLQTTGNQKAGIDIVMLQDGAGERRLTQANVKPTIEPYYQSFQAMCAQKGVKFWANVESWEYSPGFWPTNIDRLTAQIMTTAPLVDEVVTFDFFHYMNPYGHLHTRQPGYPDAEAQLYCDYLRKFMPGTTPPAGVQCPP